MRGRAKCPFCGSDEGYEEYNGEGDSWIYCSSCSARGPRVPYESDALTAWNGRAESTVPLETELKVIGLIRQELTLMRMKYSDMLSQMQS